MVAVFVDPVDRRHHGFGGAEVFTQCVGAFFHALPCLQVGVDVRAPEPVDSLLGIADHQQAGVGVAARHIVNAVENAVLHRVGVLEFVDQGHRKLAPDSGCQLIATGTVQGFVQPGKQIVKAHFRAFLLFRFQPFRYPVAGVV